MTQVIEQNHGRTFWDFLNSAGGVILLLLILGTVAIFGIEYIIMVPAWIYVALGLSIIWIPWLIERAKDDAQLFIVAHGPQQISEFRVGRRVNLQLEGAGVPLTSQSGAQRTLLTEFNPITKTAKGSALAEFTQFEMARDLSTLDRLSKEFAEHLRSERISGELITVEVEKKVKNLSTRWMQIAMSTLEPEELELALDLVKHDDEMFAPIGEVLDDVE